MTAEDVRKAKENKATRSESDLSGDSEDSDSEDSGRTSANTGAVPLASVLNLRGFRAELTVRKNWAMTAENVRAAKEKALKTFLGFEHGVPCRLEEDARTVLGLEIDRNKYWPEKEKKKKLNETQLRCLEDYLVLCLWDAEKAARAGEDDSLVSGFGGLSAAQTALKSDATFGTHFQARF
ncbi:hypothetical protein FACS1894198_6310 [Clostridia bacterium]|nr:hypothetical protein FACS1894198_6310 [Clostridia bacterium]